jgi:hypothetical protein
MVKAVVLTRHGGSDKIAVVDEEEEIEGLRVDRMLEKDTLLSQRSTSCFCPIGDLIG